MTANHQPLSQKFADGVPDDDDLWGDLRWEDARDEETNLSGERLERFVQDRTSTEVEIKRSQDGTHSVQASLGGYGDGEAVIQPDDPNTFHSATTTVLDLGVEDIGEARALAFAWIRGWAHRNNTYHSKGVRDLDRSDRDLPEADF